MHDYASNGGGFTIKSDELRELAKKADEISGNIASIASYTADASDAATKAHTGWRLASALDEAQSVWKQNMHSFGEQVADVGDKLRTTAQNYKESDQRGADGFHGQRDEGSRPGMEFGERMADVASRLLATAENDQNSDQQGSDEFRPGTGPVGGVR